MWATACRAACRAACVVRPTRAWRAQDCGHPFYVANYIAFYAALRVAYPHMQLIANCDLGQAAPTDMWDWHLYTNSWEMFKARGAFDGMVRPPANPESWTLDAALAERAWHMYTNSWEMFEARGAFDGMVRP